MIGLVMMWIAGVVTGLLIPSFAVIGLVIAWKDKEYIFFFLLLGSFILLILIILGNYLYSIGV